MMVKALSHFSYKLRQMYWFGLSRLASVYMITSELVGRIRRLKTPFACHKCKRNLRTWLTVPEDTEYTVRQMLGNSG